VAAGALNAGGLNASAGHMNRRTVSPEDDRAVTTIAQLGGNESRKADVYDRRTERAGYG